MSVEIDKLSVNNLSEHISEGIEMFDDSSLLVDNNTSPDKPSSFYKEYKTDHTTPPGWSGRGGGSRFFLRSPAGVIFRSRRAAFEDMVISGKYPDAQVEAMRDSLIHEGWEDSKDIPDGWKIKKRKYGIFLMEQGGRMLESSVKAHGFILKYKKYYSDEDYQKIVVLSKPNGHQKRVVISQEPSQIKTELNRATLTEDLSYDDTEVNEEETSSLFSPSFIDKTRVEVNVKSHRNYPENNMPLINDSMNPSLEEPIEQNLVEDQPQPEKKRKTRRSQSTTILDWQEDKLLYPPGWKYAVINRQNKEPFSKLLSPSGSQMSIRGALFYMVTNDYPEEEIEMIRRAMLKHNWQQHSSLPEKWLYKRLGYTINLCDNVGRMHQSKERAIEFISNEANVDNSSILMLQRFQPPSILNIENDDTWRENEEIYPPGWKCKVIQLPAGAGGGDKKYEKVMSPSGEFFICRRAVLSHMIKQQFSSEDIQKLQSAVEKSGWLTSRFLPLGWTYKRKSKNSIEFSNEEGKCLGSKKKTLKRLSKNPNSYLNEIQMVENFFKEKTEFLQENNNVFTDFAV